MCSRGSNERDHREGPHNKPVGRLIQLEWRGPRDSIGRVSGVKVSDRDIAHVLEGLTNCSNPSTPMPTPS